MKTLLTSIFVGGLFLATFVSQVGLLLGIGVFVLTFGSAWVMTR